MVEDGSFRGQRRRMASGRKRPTFMLLAGIGAAVAIAASLVLLLPANAQFWGDSWGGRQRGGRDGQQPGRGDLPGDPPADFVHSIRGAHAHDG